MAPWNRRRAEKALNTNTPGARDISDIVSAVVATQMQMAGGVPLDRPKEWVNSKFGPGWPLAPDPLDEPRQDSDLPEPRLNQYPVAWNVPGTQGRHVIPWETLKKAAETPLFRACIEIRKNEIATLDWAIRPSPKYIDREAKNSGTSKHDVEKQIREKYKDEIRQGNEFWETPDRKNGRDFSQWIALLLEEQLTWDAMAIYPHKTYGGSLEGLWIIDGSTIKPLMDETGGRPQPPAPAYQQILYGYPRGEFTADTVEIDGDLVVPNGLTASQLIYERRVHRSWTPFGTTRSPSISTVSAVNSPRG